MAQLERVSLAIEQDLLERFDALCEARGRQNRSEAIRDLIRGQLVEEEWRAGDNETVGTVTLVYDHKKRDLSDKLVETGHQHHDAIVASMHVHLDHDYCLEVIAMRGRADDLRHLAESLIG
ncbi:MAG: nickel-responsive transcriptional regulator NikR, partial [Deltaproteobacteria bacterium]|nr:nickel-responsive transcriptional regulator NikR [Deltaproteobacteria bacterium]